MEKIIRCLNRHDNDLDRLIVKKKEALKFSEIEFREYSEVCEDEKRYEINPKKFYLLSFITLGLYYLFNSKSYDERCSALELRQIKNKLELIENSKQIEKCIEELQSKQQQISLFFELYDSLNGIEKKKLFTRVETVWEKK